MKIRNMLLFVFAFTLVTSMQAQENKENKKVVIVKKKDENGKVTEERIEAEGKEADELIKKMEKKHGDFDKKKLEILKIEKSEKKEETKSGKKEIEIEAEIVDGVTKERYKIIKKDGDNEQVIEWDGEGEMPKELAEELKHMNIRKEMDGNRMMITIDSDDIEGMDFGDEEIHIAHRDDKRKEKMILIDKDEKGFFPNGEVQMLDFKKEKRNDNKVSLGVMIEDTDNGVVVSDIVPGSAAESAGLRRGDVILKVNKTYIFSSNGLLDALNPYNANEKVKIKYIREGKEKSTSAKLKAKK